jgi:hypothetical protein
MPKLTINRPGDGIFWPQKGNEKAYLPDVKCDLGLRLYQGYGISLAFLLPGKQTTQYGQLDLKPEQAEQLADELSKMLEQFKPEVVIRGKEENNGSRI